MIDYYNTTKKYFVNLDNKTDRLNSTREQVGDKFIRWPACQGDELTFDQLDSLFDMSMCNKRYHCNQTKRQASATISQYAIYEHIAKDDSLNDDDFVLICEDDNKYVKDFEKKFNQLRAVLDQDRFENIELVIMKYMIIQEQFDFCKMASLMTSDNITDKDIQTLKDNGFTDRQIEVFTKYRFRAIMRINPQHICSFDYQDVSESDDPELYTVTQNLFTTHKIQPFSASCYLIRKRVCKRIVSKYKKPWWYTDDFKQLVSLQNILLCSPFLATEAETSGASSINEFATLLNHYNNTLVSKRFKYRFFMLKKLVFISKWNISTSTLKRKFIKLLQKALYL